jgi:prepilin-type processing-associated H-X9-DG protein
MSATLLVAEWLVGAQSVSDRRREFYRPDSSGSRPFVAACLAAANGPALPMTRKGSDWQYGNWPNTLYDHALPPNAPNCLGAVSDHEFIGSCAAGSMHANGVHVLMADGHARFVRDDIERNVWTALGTRNGGEVISAEDL